MPAPFLVSVKKMVWLHEQRAKEQMHISMNILSSKGTAITGLPQYLAKNEIQFESLEPLKAYAGTLIFFASQLFQFCVIEQKNCSSFPLHQYFQVIILAANKSVEYRLQSFLLV